MRLYARELFPAESHKTVEPAGHLRVEPDRVQAAVIRDEDRALIVELLRDDRQFLLPEDLSGADDRVQRPQSGKVAVDFPGRHAGGDQGLLHIGRLGAAVRDIVAADEQVVHLPGPKEPRRRFDAIAEEQVPPPVRDDSRAAEHQPHAPMRHGLRIVISPAAGRDDHAGRRAGEHHQAKDRADGRQPRGFPPEALRFARRVFSGHRRIHH